MTKPLAMFMLILLLSSGVQATPLTYSGSFSGLNEFPSNASLGTGTAKVAYDSVLQTLLVEVAFSGLTGSTTAAHIHCCTLPGTNAGVAIPFLFPTFPLGVLTGSLT